jgi:hypothetical protein
MEIKRFFFAGVILLACITGWGQQIINTQTELKRLSDIALLPRYFDGTFVKQESSYDRTGGNDDGFSGKYSFLRKNEGGGLVIFEAKGQGVIERIWTPTPTDDTLDFYFDGNVKPSLSIKFRDLFNGTVAPFIKPLVDAHLVGGYYSYVPIPYSNGCKIVFRGEKIMFHQIQYREYDKRYRVQNFNPLFSVSETKVLKDVTALWKNNERTVFNFYKGANKIESLNSIKPGQSKTIADLKQGGRILGLEIMPSAIFEGGYKQLDLKITWDNAATPAVYVPIADFFGYSFGERAMESLYLGATESKLYSYIPMPFDRAAKIEIVHRANALIKDPQPANIRAVVYYSNVKRNAISEGKFYAFWKNNSPDTGKPYVFLNGKGKGHYIGTILNVQALTYTDFTEFFEGDDSTVIDGINNIHGTGSEDYFNGGWYAQPGGWTERGGAPLSGCLSYSIPLSRTGGYRFYITDKLPFYKSIYHSMEHGPVHNNRPVQNVSVAMYYAEAPVEQNAAPVNELTKNPIPPEFTFYTNFLKHLTYNGDVQFRNGNAFINGTGDASVTINVNELPGGRYKMYMYKIISSVNTFDVRLSDSKRIQDWRTVKLTADNKREDVYLGEVELNKTDIPQMPVNILFRSKTPNPNLEFGRIRFVKQ